MTGLPNDHEPGRAMIPAYFTNNSASGPVRYGQLPGSIGVLEALDKPMPIGMASAIGRTERGLNAIRPQWAWIPFSGATPGCQCRRKCSTANSARRRTDHSAPSPVAIALKVRELRIRTHAARLMRGGLHSFGWLSYAKHGFPPVDNRWDLTARVRARAPFMRNGARKETRKRPVVSLTLRRTHRTTVKNSYNNR